MSAPFWFNISNRKMRLEYINIERNYPYIFILTSIALILCFEIKILWVEKVKHRITLFDNLKLIISQIGQNYTVRSRYACTPLQPS